MSANEMIEPAAVHADGSDSERAVVSIAISLRRLADMLEKCTGEDGSNGLFIDVRNAGPR